MSKEMMFFLLYGVLCGAFGVFANRLYLLGTAYFKMKESRKVFPYLEAVTKNNICSGPHEYDRITLAFAAIPTGEYLVCKCCGFVSTARGQYKLNAPAMEVYKNELDRRSKAIKAVFEQNKLKNEMMHEAMNRLIKGSVANFEGPMQSNIEELQQFFRKTQMEIESINETLKKDVDG